MRTASENAVRDSLTKRCNLADARVEPVTRPEPHTRDIGLSDQAFVRDVIDGNTVVELTDDGRAIAAGCGLRRRAGAPFTVDEALIDVLVLEQDDELVVLESRAESDATCAHV